MSSHGFQQSAYIKYSADNTYSNDIDIGNDVVKTGNIFLSDPKKHEDLKLMLESSKDQAKLEAMKRIISMVARGKDCGELFPSVVKNVVSKNAEVKKLVYAYLTRYAEEQQELALLSISTFQRALKDPNQLIRGSALRVLSSIRVPMIVPIMMLAINECVMDMSPYVRKIAANAIPKMYSLDPSTKTQMIKVIEKLLGDKTTLVAGSAIQAFEEVCPDRLDLIHKHYRRLCSLLIDVEEWGQIVIIKMMTRYARTQFVDPNLTDIIEERKTFYSDGESTTDSSGSDDNKKSGKLEKMKPMDSDHRLLLNSAKPLLQSRNSAVVMSVVQLYYHCAPAVEMNIVVKSMIRLLKLNKEVQFVVLNNIATMSTTRPELLLNHLKSFYVYNCEPTQVKLLKLEILTNLANESNISMILRELQSYVGSTDQEFVKSTIQSIGRCASNISEISDTCLSGLVQLISRIDENIVAEAVVVIRKLLQMQTADHKDIIVSLAVLMDSINIPMAKASIIWLIGEYCDRVPKLGPDVLRKSAKSFVDETDIVKLQTLNLAAKLYVTNTRQTHLLVQYVLNLAKYDLNYDIRDRARFIKALLFPPVNNENNTGEINQNGTSGNTFFLSKRVKKIFLATKPAPFLESNFKDRHPYQLSTMSHILNVKVPGYSDLPDWPEVAPDPSVRNVPDPSPATSGSRSTRRGDRLLANEKGVKSSVDAFYSDEEEEDEEDSDMKEESDSEENDEDDEKDGDDDDEEEEDDDEEEEEEDEEEEEEEDMASSSSTESSTDDNSVQKKNNETLVTKASRVDKVKLNDSLTTEEPKRNQSGKTKQDVIVKNKTNKKQQKEEEEGDSFAEESSETDSTESDTSADEPAKSKPAPVPSQEITKSSKNKIKPPEVDLLLDFGDINNENDGQSNNKVNVPAFGTSILQPSSVIDQLMSSPSTATELKLEKQEIYIPNDIPPVTIEVLPKYSNNFVFMTARFPRSLSMTMSNSRLVSLELIVVNISNETLHNIKISPGPDSAGASIECFSHIDTLLPDKTVTLSLGVDFHDSSQPIRLNMGFSLIVNYGISEQGEVNNQHESSPESPTTKSLEQEKNIEIKISAPIGELLQPISMTENEFQNNLKKLRGMNESSFKIEVSNGFNDHQLIKELTREVYEVANITTVSSTFIDSNYALHFAGMSSSQKLPCLISLDYQSTNKNLEIKVNSEQVTLLSQLTKELKNAVQKILGK